MAVSRPLAIAIVAMSLLVVSVGFEVLVQRTFALDVRVGDEWRTLAVSETSNDPYRTTPVGATDPIVANASDTLTFRVRVDNGYPWAYSEHYYVSSWRGSTIADGELTAPGRGYGEATFSLVLGRIMSEGALTPEGGPKSAGYRSANLNVNLDEVYLSASFDVQEVS